MSSIKRNIFSVELSDIDVRNLDVIRVYLENHKGIQCKRGEAIRMLMAERYESILNEAKSAGKVLDDYIKNV